MLSRKREEIISELLNLLNRPKHVDYKTYSKMYDKNKGNGCIVTLDATGLKNKKITIIVPEKYMIDDKSCNDPYFSNNIDIIKLLKDGYEGIATIRGGSFITIEAKAEYGYFVPKVIIKNLEEVSNK